MPTDSPVRIKQCLNRQWKFFRGECAGAQATDYDDSAWSDAGLPHTFDLPYFRTPEFYVGCGWYRRSFWVPGEWGRKCLFLEFEGAFQVADVFLNGERVGRHEGGYTGFSIDITAAARIGENRLAVRVDNEWNGKLAPRAGEHIFSGGLYRDVYLLATNAQHIPYYGIGVTTPSVSAETSVACVQIELRNQSDRSATCTVETQLLDPDGKRVGGECADQLQVPPNSLLEIRQTTAPIDRPLLWHPDHPHLYTARTIIRAGDEVVDQVDTTFGFRWFQWTADRGFFLNGRHLYLRGANVHQDHAGWGIGITQAACERDVRLIKEAGFNFIRGAHYPHHPAFARACDRLGVLFWSEACFWGKGGYGPEGYWNASAYPVAEEDKQPFAQSCRQMLGEMIRSHRNHPSIVVWSMTNEAFFTFNLEQAKTLMREMVQWSHELDPTRPAAIGGAQRGEVDRIGDVAGYNGDGARLFLDPGIPNMVSEYGAISKPHEACEPFFGELQSDPFPWRSGQAIWCGFDYGSIAGKQGLKGILHHNRLPKRSWHWYRKAYRGIEPPVWPRRGDATRLRLTADRQILQGTDAIDDAQLVVTALGEDDLPVGDCPPITLSIESGPGEFPTGPTITFASGTDLPVVGGQAAIAFRSYHGGVTRFRADAAGCAPAFIEIQTLGEPAFVQGRTPAVAPRPYHPPQPSQAALAAMRNAVDVARDRPTSASSESPPHAPRCANDANPATFWQPAGGDSLPWLQVDLEGFYQLSSCRLAFAAAGNARYLVEVSNDRIHWQTGIDRRNTVRTDAVRNDVLDPGTVARYVRVTLTAQPPQGSAVQSVELQGILSVR